MPKNTKNPLDSLRQQLVVKYLPFARKQLGKFRTFMKIDIKHFGFDELVSGMHTALVDSAVSFKGTENGVGCFGDAPNGFGCYLGVSLWRKFEYTWSIVCRRGLTHRNSIRSRSVRDASGRKREPFSVHGKVIDMPVLTDDDGTQKFMQPRLLEETGLSEAEWDHLLDKVESRHDERTAQIIRWHCLEGYNFNQIARWLRTSRRSVQRMVQRLREKDPQLTTQIRLMLQCH